MNLHRITVRVRLGLTGRCGIMEVIQRMGAPLFSFLQYHSE